MLRHTFCHLPGIGEKTERRLWAAGLTRWEDALDNTKSPVPRRLRTEVLRESATEYERANLKWFAGRLPPAETWRLFPDFRGSCAFLDIETTGLERTDQITTIALYDGRTARTYVQGENLHEFLRDITAYRLLVTYNGKTFDLPFLERALRCRFDQAHIDLRYVLASVGLKGGLKGCERLLDIRRSGLEEINGFVAVMLWHDFRRTGDRRALETLLAYNVQDVLSLESLMVHAYNRKLEALIGAPFAAACRLPLPPAPANPFRPEPEVVKRILRDNPWILTAQSGQPTVIPALAPGSAPAADRARNGRLP